jgi:hypothetical protein
MQLYGLIKHTHGQIVWLMTEERNWFNQAKNSKIQSDPIEK